MSGRELVESGNVTGDGKVTKELLKKGDPSAPAPVRGQKVSVHYVGKLTNGKQFDSSRDRKEPFEFTIGQGVIAGWSLAVPTMRVGELSRFTIHADYAYKDKGFPGLIPPGSTLVFDIELLAVK
jgi:FKBP-type peptidyl-prolyl cis-trans isomerase